MRESKQQSQKLMYSPFHQNFQNQPSYSSFQAQSQQNDEPIDYEKLLEVMTQVQIAHNHDIDLMVTTLHGHHLTTPDVTNHFVRAKKLCCFEN